VSSPSRSDLLKRALAVTGSQAALARAMGMNRSRLNRVINSARFGFKNCLRLATVIDEYPHVVLRAYNYTSEADILQQAYTTPRFTVKQIEVAELYGKATPKQKRLTMDWLSELTGAARKAD
jgi:plasmid maintenance system antidote protein VapI